MDGCNDDKLISYALVNDYGAGVKTYHVQDCSNSHFTIISVSCHLHNKNMVSLSCLHDPTPHRNA